jgi:hypothetical protein
MLCGIPGDKEDRTVFAQLVITIVLAWLVAEMLCRLSFGRSATSAVRLFFDPYADERTRRAAETSHPDLRNLLRERREQLDSARTRRDLAERAAGVSEELTSVEQELSALEERLDDLERERFDRSYR